MEGFRIEGFRIENYTKYFKKEKVEIVRWDNFDYKSIRLMFTEEPLKTSARTLIEHVKKLSREEIGELEKKLNFGDFRRYKFNEIIQFIKCYCEEDKDIYVIDSDDIMEYDMDQNEIRIGTSYYSDPYWLLWKHKFVEVLDVLENWTYSNSKEYKDQQERLMSAIFGVSNEEK